MNEMMTHIAKWQTPASSYPNRKLGKARLHTTTYRRGNLYHMYFVTNPDGHRYRYYRCSDNVKIKTLSIDGREWMIDDPPHWFSMVEHAKHYRGHVLCAGLGLGLIVHALTARPEVESITVVERERDVIKLVWPLVPQEKATIVEADWYSYRHGSCVDGVFNDLFVGNGYELINQGGAALAHARSLYPTATVLIHGFSQELINEIANTYLSIDLPPEELAKRAIID